MDYYWNNSSFRYNLHSGYGIWLYNIPGGAKTGIQSETADQSSTSGPGHNTTDAGGAAAIQSQQRVAANTTGPGTEQIPDSEVTFGRETSTLQTPIARQQGVNNSTNSTNSTSGGLANPLSENLTSLTGTSS
ncbi:MAG: hypothetical protein ACJ70V_03765 [Nitrososphaera sp.]